MATNVQNGTGDFYLLKWDGETKDIITAIKQADALSVDYVRDFAPSMDATTIKAVCKNLYNYVRKNIPYREDESEFQFVQSPGMLYNNRYAKLGGTGLGGDCKSMSIFCAAVLKCLGINDFDFRFTAQDPADDYHHVYLVVYDQETGEAIYLDCTIDGFNRELNYAKNFDMPPHIEQTTYPAVGDPQSSESDLYKDEIENVRQNYAAIRNNLKIRCIASIDNKWKGKPVRKEAAYLLFASAWKEFLHFTQCLIYHWWEDHTLPNDILCRMPGDSGAIPFPSKYAEKKKTSDDFFTEMKQIGLSDQNILDLADLATYNQYGITLDYMLYRCKCFELYGQNWKPSAGVPYFDMKTGNFVPNGSTDLGAIINIMLCLPSQGGLTRPLGTPYWTRGGFIMSNGATEPQIEEWLKNNYRPGTNVHGTIVPGYIVPEPGITEQQQLAALAQFNLWLNGNMPGLPASSIKDKANKMGTQYYVGTVEVIISIIGAVIAAITAITAIVVKIIEITKKDKTPDNTPFPTQDFKMDYPTADGCYIASCVNQTTNCGGTAKLKVCPNGTYVPNPDLNNPANQPIVNNFGEDDPFNSKWPWIVGGGALLAGSAFLLLKEK